MTTKTKPERSEPEDEGTLTGRVLGDFSVLTKLGQGGVGAAYIANQTLLGREAVIKVLRAGSEADGFTQSRFLREARLASRIDHPFAVQVYAFGAEPDGLLWIAMELVRGVPLSAWLKEHGPMPLAQFAPFFDTLCDVVDAVHEKGIVHRDLKPSNVMVMVRNGRLLPKLLDLGIATVVSRPNAAKISIDEAAFFASLDTTPNRRHEQTSSLMNIRRGPAAPYEPIPTPTLMSTSTPTDTLARIDLAEKFSITREAEAVGSPNYMAPEQWLNSREVAAQADIYSLGVLAWQTLTGKFPYTAANTTGMAMAHLHSPIPLLPKGFPDGLQEVFLRALAKKPEERYPKASDLGRNMMAVATRSQRALPALPATLRQEWVDSAPQPLAETVALLEAVRNPRAGFEVVGKITKLLPRFLGLVGLLCRQRIGQAAPDEEQLIANSVTALRNGRLEQHGWLTLLWNTVSPWAAKRERYPIPELLDFCVTGKEKSEAFKLLENLDLEQLPTDDEAAYARYDAVLGELAQIMRASSFLVRLTMARASGEPGVFESYKGCRRPVRATVNARMPSAVEGDLFFFDEALSPRLRLNPLLQLLSPSPGEPGEVFLFDGAGRHGARFVAAPREFERQDESTWSWFDQQWPPQASSTSRGGERQRPPYRGLASFTAVDAQDFFGREAEAETVANRLRVAPFLAVVGPSGVGKSSFVQAGVGPLLSQDLTVIVVRPGNTPMPTLLQKIATLGVDIEGLATEIEKDPAAFGKRLTQFALAQRTQYLLLVDQFEEVLTLCPSVIERERYAAALVSACASLEGPVRVMLTMRDDFLIRAQALEALKDSLSTGLHLLGTPQEHELVRILTQPLKRLGYAFEDPELPKQMVQEVARQPGALALLSFSATRLWEARDTHFRRLTRQAYQAMGGVGGALAGHAEETLSSMSEQARAITREAFRHLVSSSGTRAVLTRAETSELLGGAGPGAEVLEKLIDARLLVTSEGSDGDDRVEIIHEALLSSWPRLVQWQRENAELARVRDTLRATSRQWNEQGRPRGMLWRDETLAEYRFWRAKYPGSLTAVEQAFANASVREFERGRRIRRGLLVSAFVVLAVGMAVLVRANGRAEANARESAERLLKMTADQGRQAFLSGHPVEALRLLSSAAQSGLDNAGMRYMIGKATRAAARQRAAVDLGVNITALGLSPSGEQVAIASMDGTVGLYEPGTLKLQHALPSMAAAVRSVRFTPNGAALVGCSTDGIVSVWSTTTFATLDSLQLEPGLLVCEPKVDGLIAAAGMSSVLHLISFNGHSLAKVGESKYDGSAVAGIRWSPDGTRFVTYMAQTVGPPAPTRRHPIESLSGPPVWLNGLRGPVLAAQWSADGQLVFTGGEDPVISIWDASTGVKRGELKGHQGAVTGLALTTDGKSLLSTGLDGTLRQWDIKKGALEWVSQAHEGLIRHLLPTPRGLIVTGGIDHVIRIWSATGQLRASMPPQSGGLPTLVLDQGRAQILSGGLDGTARIYDLSAVDFVEEVPVPSDAAATALDDSESSLLVSSYDGPFVLHRLGAPDSSATLQTTLFEDRAFAFASDAGLIATDRGSELAVIDRENRVLQSLPGHPDGEGRVLLNATATHVLATGSEEEPLVYEWRTGDRRPLPGPIKTMAAIFSTANPSDVWVGTNGGEVIFWPDQGLVRRKQIGRAGVISISESPDARLIALTTVDQRLHLLRADTLEEVGVGLTGIRGTMLGFSADSQLLLLGEPGGLVQVWNLDPFEQVDSHKVGQKLFQLTPLRTRPQFLTLTSQGLLIWSL